MANLTATASQVSIVNETEPEIRTYIAAAAITAGQAVYLNSAGKVDLARGNAVGTAGCVGLALNTTGANQAVAVLQRGAFTGFDLSGMAYGAKAYVSSANAGAVADTIVSGSGNVVTPVGQVVSMSDPPDYTKVLWVDIDLTRVPTALP